MTTKLFGIGTTKKEKMEAFLKNIKFILSPQLEF
jgi:hypothetical protein